MLSKIFPIISMWYLAARTSFITWVNHVLNNHMGCTIQEFKLVYFLNNTHQLLIDTWVAWALSKHVQTLVLDFTPPSATYGSSASHKYYYVLDLTLIPSFNTTKLYLTTLCLKSVNVDTQTLNYILHACASTLESLCVVESQYLTTIASASLPSLKSFMVLNCPQLEKIDIQAPKLVSLTYNSGLCSILRVFDLSTIFDDPATSATFFDDPATTSFDDPATTSFDDRATSDDPATSLDDPATSEILSGVSETWFTRSGIISATGIRFVRFLVLIVPYTHCRVAVSSKKVAGSSKMMDGSSKKVAGSSGRVERVVVASSGKEASSYGKEVVVSGKEVAVGGKEILVSGKEVVVCGKEFVVSGKDVVVSGQDGKEGVVVVSGKEGMIVSSKEGVVISGKGVVVSGREGVVVSGKEILVSGKEVRVSANPKADSVLASTVNSSDSAPVKVPAEYLYTIRHTSSLENLLIELEAIDGCDLEASSIVRPTKGGVKAMQEALSEAQANILELAYNTSVLRELIGAEVKALHGAEGIILKSVRVFKFLMDSDMNANFYVPETCVELPEILRQSETVSYKHRA